MTWKYPWAISGVDEIGLDVARVLAFTATGGAEGVVAPTDLKVSQLSTAGASVQIAKGAFSCLNRYSSGVSESYIGYNDGTITTAIAATGGSSRTDLVYAHITDPGQPNNPAVADEVTTRVIQGVSTSVTQLSDVPGYATTAGYALARITIPANTTAITNAMITDLRDILQPKQVSVTKIYNTPNTGADSSVTTSWTTFPAPASWNIFIPTWATRMAVVGHIAGLEVRGTTSQDWGGWVRVRAASTWTDSSYINAGITVGSKDTYTTVMGADLGIVSTDRGKTKNFAFEMVKNGGSATMWSAAGTVCVLQVEFYNTTE